MESKITKGNWEIIDHSWSDTSIYCGEKQICTNSIYEEATEETQEELEDEVLANFKLMTASPDLLDALKMLLAAYQSDGTDDFHNVDVVYMAEKAISKATI